MHEPANSFNQAALKIQWSKVLIDNLGSICTSFIKEKPYHISFQRDAEAGSYSFEVGLAREIPAEIPLLMGDICGNLRASLDYAWMGLVRKENPGQLKKFTLPIGDNRKGLVATIGKSPVKAAAKETEFLLADTIRSHRDFASGGNLPIAALNDLSNWNKHNLLIAAAGVTSVPDVTLNSRSHKNLRIGGVKVHGGVCSLAEIVSSECEISYDGEPTVDVLFGDHDLVKDEPVIPALRDLAQAALEALHAFCEVFPDPDNPRFGH